MTTTLRLKFMGAETALARLYQDEKGREQWVPKSVCDHTRKWPSQAGQPAGRTQTRLSPHALQKEVRFWQNWWKWVTGGGDIKVRLCRGIRKR